MLFFFFFLRVFTGTLEYGLCCCDLWRPDRDRTPVCPTMLTTSVLLLCVTLTLALCICVSEWLCLCGAVCVQVCVCVWPEEHCKLLSPRALCCGGDEITSQQHSYFQSSTKKASLSVLKSLLSQPRSNITPTLIIFQEENKPPKRTTTIYQLSTTSEKLLSRTQNAFGILVHSYPGSLQTVIQW